MSSEPTSGSRRERNKLATRQALADGAYEIAVSQGLAAVTAAAVAEAAGVSRRTFFNYFASTDAALSESVISYIEAIADEIGERPMDETLAESAERAFRRAATPERLERLAQLIKLVEAADGATVAMFTWIDAHNRLAGILRDRCRDVPDELYVETVAAVLLTVARVGMTAWSRARTERGSPAHGVTAEELVELRDSMLASLGTVVRGLEPAGSAIPSSG